MMPSCLSSLFSLKRSALVPDFVQEKQSWRDSLQADGKATSSPARAGHHVTDQKNSGKLDTTERLEDLRDLMETSKLECYVIPTSDAHGSEYVGQHDERRAFISG